MNSSVKTKTVNGFKWGLIDNFANSGVTFIVGLVLANLLTAEEFGVLGIITIFINLSITVIDGGFTTALIRKK
jgi:O-antigen/teichoic acid export membrane protein